MSGKGNKISVIIPTYNYARYLNEAIESVLSQTFNNLEIIVVDDGSTDNTREITRPYKEKGLINYIYQENKGQATARNTGILNSNGHYITFLDADDILLPDCLGSIAIFMEKYQEVGFVFTNYDLFDEKGIVNTSGVDIWKIFRKIPHSEIEDGKWIFTEKLTKYIIKYGSFMHTSGVTIRKDLLKGSGLFTDGHLYGEDDDFFARVTYICKSGYIDNVLSRKRNHPESFIHDKSKWLRGISNLVTIPEKQRDYFKEDEEIQNILNKKIPRIVFDYCWHLIDRRNFNEAQKILFHYLKQYKKSWPLYKLLVKGYLFHTINR